MLSADVVPTRGPFDDYTDHADVTPKVLAELQRADNPRFLQVIESLVTHLHAFARDVRLTEEEFHLACACSTRSARPGITTRRYEFAPEHRPSGATVMTFT